MEYYNIILMIVILAVLIYFWNVREGFNPYCNPYAIRQCQVGYRCGIKQVGPSGLHWFY